MEFIDRYMLSVYIKQNICDKLHISNNDVEINVNSIDEMTIQFSASLGPYDDKVVEKIVTESIDVFTKERGKFYVREEL